MVCVSLLHSYNRQEERQHYITQRNHSPGLIKFKRTTTWGVHLRKVGNTLRNPCPAKVNICSVLSCSHVRFSLTLLYLDCNLRQSPAEDWCHWFSHSRRFATRPLGFSSTLTITSWLKSCTCKEINYKNTMDWNGKGVLKKTLKLNKDINKSGIKKDSAFSHFSCSFSQPSITIKDTTFPQKKEKKNRNNYYNYIAFHSNKTARNKQRFVFPRI